MLLGLLITGCTTDHAASSPESPSADLRDEWPALPLRELARLGAGADLEISGIVRSHRDPSVFWTLGDSGNPSRIYPIRVDGRVIPSVRYPAEPGTLIGNTINGDWEDIAIDASGRIVIADVGNNTNARADLCVYIVPEPEPTEGRTSVLSQVFIRYADQRSLPAPKAHFNFDAEAVFTVGNDIFILTKHRSDTLTTLYCLADQPSARLPGVVHELQPLGSFDVLGEVTGADATENGLRLAVLTYGRIWLFERASTRQSWFEGKVRTRRFTMPDGQPSDTESICFENDDTLLLADETRAALYRVQIAELPVR